MGERGIELVTGAHAVKFDDSLLQISPGEAVQTDAVISTPRIEGRQIGAIPTDASGFVAVDAFSKVIGLERVYAAGDVTAFPVKQGGIATQQADAAAEAIAADLGVDLAPRPFDPVLRATLWTGQQPEYLTASWPAALERPRSSAIMRSGSMRARSSGATWHRS